MDKRDERATNLLSRLFAYTPREGRQALEDYCTEALAWCLVKSPQFLTKFLKLTDIPRLSDWHEPADVHTQVRFIGEDEANPLAGRFDLVIQSSQIKKPFVLVVESKVGSGFGPKQLKMYRDRLNVPDAFPGVPKELRYLVTLTTIHRTSTLTNGKNTTWPDVFNLVEKTSHPDDPCVRELFCQFASFLKEKGLCTLDLMKTNEKIIVQWFEVKKLESQLMKIIGRLRNQKEIREVVGRNKAKHQDENAWLGISGKNDFWAGFGFKSGFYVWVEITLPGDHRKETLDSDLLVAFDKAKHYLELHRDKDAINFNNLRKGDSRFVFAREINEDLNGDGEAVFTWLDNISKKAIALTV
jgi:hypothetical protein